MYKIGEFSRVCRASIKTLRYYDDLGVLKPSYIDDISGYRYYSPEKIAEYNKVMILKEIGFSLEDIKKNFLNLTYENALLLLKNKRIELLNTISESQARLTKLDTLRKLISEEEKNMDFNVTVKETDLIKIAAIRDIYSDRNTVKATIEAIRKFLVDNHIQYHEEPIIVNYDVEYFQSDVDLAIGLQIFGELPKNDYVKVITVQPYKNAASLVCKNSDKARELSYSSLTYWLENNSYQVTGAYIEIYHDEQTLEILVPVYECKSNPDCPRQVHSQNEGIPFKNDERVIGKWDIVDILPSREQFSKRKVKYNSCKIAEEIYFLPSGQQYWIWGWTKDFLVYHTDMCKVYNKYEIFDMDGQLYMFIEMIIGDDVFKDVIPEVYVLKKSDNMHYTRDEIMIHEKTDYPFINDEQVLGNWVACDFVPSIEEFNPEHKQYPKESIWFKKICCKENGILEQRYGDGRVLKSPDISWTKGLTLLHRPKLAPAYELRRINGCDYLFVEWKSGDYIFGKRKPSFYVFNRED